MNKLYETINAANWCKGAAAKDSNGGPMINVKHERAVRWCVSGHLERQLEDAGELDDLLEQVAPAIVTLFPERIATICVDSVDEHRELHADCVVASFNDHPDTTLDDVLRVCKLADV